MLQEILLFLPVHAWMDTMIMVVVQLVQLAVIHVVNALCQILPVHNVFQDLTEELFQPVHVMQGFLITEVFA